jgi:glycosyltransferase involved in cell wall biosynthesis
VSLVCVIPAFDAEHALAQVVADLRGALPEARVMVVDDGSRDGTPDIARGCADIVVHLDHNQGKGAALRAGFARALDEGATRILTLDADGQHLPSEAPAILAALDDADVVVGRRARAGTAMPPRRRFANWLSSASISRCMGQRMADTQSGFRAMRASVVRALAPRGARYEFETDFLILAARGGYRVVDVPITTVYARGDDAHAQSHFRAVSDTARVVRAIARHRRFFFQGYQR